MSINFPGGYYDGAATYYDQGDGNWKLRIEGEGNVYFTSSISVDIFLVGGGASGTLAGGGSGFTKTKKGIVPALNSAYHVVIGAGGVGKGASGGTTSGFGISASGGYGQTGGSGGGDYLAGVQGSIIGGSNGSNGGSKGHGQGTTTREFGEPNGELYAGGGGGIVASWNGYEDIFEGGAGGAGGGGKGMGRGSYGVESPGSPGENFKGGGGGGSLKANSFYSGGCGTLIIRNSRTGNGGYRLFIDKDEGSNISVYRTSSDISEPGYRNEGGFVYYNDLLKISFSPKANYKLLSTTVNGTPFSSDSTHRVVGDVTVKAISQPLISKVSAGDCNIGQNATIYITRYSPSYTHTLTYSFKGLTGTIATNVSADTCSWSVPTSFYKKIPNSKNGDCLITCETFEGSISLGTSTCTANIVAEYQASCPLVECNVIDVDEITTYLTGDNSVLIRNKSDPKCTIKATARHHSSITKLQIEEDFVDDGRTEWHKSFNDYSKDCINFKATDSRGYTTSVDKQPTIIKYTALTCYAELKRDSPTSDQINLNVHGDFFNESFGAYSNTLSLKFRYRVNTVDSQYTNWVTIPQTYITRGATSYYSETPINLNQLEAGASFEYTKSYVFQIAAEDGAPGHVLSTAYASEGGAGSITVNRGQPVFDWGEHDFNFNVPVNINHEGGISIQGVNAYDMVSGMITETINNAMNDIASNVLNRAYPIGSFYISGNDTSPAELFGGDWEKINGRFLLATGTPTGNTNNYFGAMSGEQWNAELGSTGGQDYHTLIEGELPYIDGEFATPVIPYHGTIGVRGHAYGTDFRDLEYGTEGNRINNPEPQFGYGIRFGNNQQHNNMPPYLAVNMWKRIG